MKSIMKKISISFGKIHLVDGCLMIIMLILVGQSIFNLFANESGSQEVNVIDVAVRTSAAAIFGYFISANFLKRREDADDEEPKDEAGDENALRTVTAESRQNAHLQVVIVTSIVIITLLTLILFRNISIPAKEAAGTISQFRDFISSGVGFLIGCATGGKKEPK